MVEFTSFDHITGNEEAKKFLTHMLETNRVGNSLLFAGAKEANLEAFALAVAHNLVGNSKEDHPDIYSFRPEGKMALHSIEGMRRFCEEVYLAPFESSYKVFIIIDAERMLPTSANALLKTFEEPAQHSVIILTSSQPNAILPTILSRCRKLYFKNSASLKQHEKLSDPLLVLLSRTPGISYIELKESLSVLVAAIEEEKKQAEQEIRQQLAAHFPQDMTALQKEAFEKEVEGSVATHTQAVLGQMFAQIFFWYRDLQLLQVSGKPDLLHFPVYLQHLEQQLQFGGLPSLETVEQAIKGAKQAIARFNPINDSLEALFLKLH